MEYSDFEQIDLPNLTVTEPNPAHVQDFRRYSSDQVIAFNAAQVAEIRPHSDAPIIHNYMGRVTDFDHFAVGGDLDIAAWDSYPLGFLADRAGASEAEKRAYLRQGDPDFQAFHHDLYRAVGKGRWWVMEQQPGPVNWAPYNPLPAPGMVRLWTWEAFAHGAEVVSYFRWRQLPFAQEQMHAGLLRPDSREAPGFAEARQVAAELAEAPQVVQKPAPIALIFDYEADWAWQTQPATEGLSYFALVFDHYKALRRAGFSIDILPASTRDFKGYKLVLAPGLIHLPEALAEAIAAAGVQALYGPRSGARTRDFAIPVPLPPAIPGLEVSVARVETLPPDCPLPLEGGGAAIRYVEELEGGAMPLLQAEDRPVAVAGDSAVYCGAWLDGAGLDRLIALLAERAGLTPRPMPEGVRTRRTGDEEFWFNYGAEPAVCEAGPLEPGGVIRRFTQISTD